MALRDEQKIVTWDIQYPGQSYPHFLRDAARRAGLHGALPAPTDVVDAPIQAVVRQGRWLVLCTHDGCASAMLASVELPCYVCPECGSTDVDGKWRPVIWPEDRSRGETALLKRPIKDSRNWEVDETVADLEQENDANGVD